MNENYRPTYLFLGDSDSTNRGIYFDTLIVQKGTTIWTYAAWGDGAHVNQVAVSGFANNGLRADDYAWHIDQLTDNILKADSFVAIRNHKVVYQKAA